MFAPLGHEFTTLRSQQRFDLGLALECPIFNQEVSKNPDLFLEYA
jgi:hypothetical protein